MLSLTGSEGKLCWLGSGSLQPWTQPRRKTVKIYNKEDNLGISVVGGRDTPLVRYPHPFIPPYPRYFILLVFLAFYFAAL